MTPLQSIKKLINQMQASIIGQQNVIERMVLTLLSEGNLLLEGLPGLAKTRAITSMAKSMDAGLSRIQFTPDLLPSDIIDSGNLTIRILFALTIYNKNRHGLDISGGIERGLIIPETDLTIEIGNGYSY